METQLTNEYRHNPVMLNEVLDSFRPSHAPVVCDCTLGGAGHSLELAKKMGPDGILIGIDQDDLALETARKRISEAFPDLESHQLKGNFSQIDELLMSIDVAGVDYFLFDIGVSSPQLDIPERGFSYNEDAPLDMRMDPGNHTLTAREVINTYNEADLTRIIRSYGEEKYASRIAHLLVERRAYRPVETTFELVEVIKQAIPARDRRTGGHPAKKTFQALRIEVNRELEVLEEGLRAAVRWLLPEGRVCVISYHSLEDRIVKRVFSELSQGCVCPPDLPVCVCNKKPVLNVLTKKPLVPSAQELEVNPRARSAKLRVAQRLA